MVLGDERESIRLLNKAERLFFEGILKVPFVTNAPVVFTQTLLANFSLKWSKKICKFSYNPLIIFLFLEVIGNKTRKSIKKN